jgi:23S rRNA (pseudouridine1915-N3)-methyltransferase
MRIRLVMLGKTRRPEIRALLEDYVARLRRYADVDWIEMRESSATAVRRAEPAAGSTVVLLDAAGRTLTSEKFAGWLREKRDGGVRDLVFLCGDAEGFPEAWRHRAGMKLSLSALTFSHELARAMLAEQLYRAFTILSGHPYPK